VIIDVIAPKSCGIPSVGEADRRPAGEGRGMSDPICPRCLKRMVPDCTGEWLSCPDRHFLDVAAEDCHYLGGFNLDVPPARVRRPERLEKDKP
jgi:hypothetical protein